MGRKVNITGKYLRKYEKIDFKSIKKKCLICGKLLKLYAARDIERTKYCSNKCKNIGHSGRMKGRTHTPETRLILSRNAKINGLGKRYGPNHHNWKGGCTPANNKIRGSGQYDEWRKKVFLRDSWTCQHCSQVGGGLNAHHIMSFSDYPSLRFEVNNGITLCEACHSQVHDRNLTRKEKKA